MLQTVLLDACASMMISTLPLALLNSQLKTMTAPMIWIMSVQLDLPGQDQRQMPAGNQHAENQRGS